MRTIDMLNIAESYAHNHGADLFSMEVWGGATFDVSMRFLKESPWARLEAFRSAMPNILLQMLLRGSNAVGYKAYPDNLIQEFVIQSAKSGIDVFRIFDSLNWLEAMKPSIHTVINETDSLAEVCMCYTGDIMNPAKSKYNLEYYLDLAKRIEDTGAHLLCIKDMAGLLKPLAAEKLIGSLKSSVDLPIHLHTHDTSSIQSATYLKAIDSGVDIVDVSISSMSGLTAQPSFNSMAAMLNRHNRERDLDLQSLNRYANYWENVRKYYYPFETELRSGTAEVYDHEIPGGQYSNLRPQARALGLEDQFDTIKQNYALVNSLFGGLIKVTPSSKVVGDMALFMTSNELSVEDVLSKSDSLAFPDSVLALMRGELGQPVGGFPENVQKAILKNEKPFTDRPNAHLEPIDWEDKKAELSKHIPNPSRKDILSYCLYDSVFLKYTSDLEKYGDLSRLPSLAFLYGMKPNEEITVTLQKGKNILIKFLNVMEADETGNRLVFFSLNGQVRSIRIKDHSLTPSIVAHKKAEKETEIGSPLQGNLSNILVHVGDIVNINEPLFTIEAMKMESTVIAPQKMKIVTIPLKEKTLVESNDLVIEFEKVE
jgi:pyruvate carboxylase